MRGEEFPHAETAFSDLPVRRGHASADDLPAAMDTLATQIGKGDLSFVVLFVSPEADIQQVAGLAQSEFTCPVIGCTTAGEISPDGYTEGEIIGIGFSASHFAARFELIRRLNHIDTVDTGLRVLSAKQALSGEHPEWDHEFALLLVDGLSLSEDKLVTALAPMLGSTPLFGGSAGDGFAFEKTFVLFDGQVHSDAALLALVRSDCPVKVFRFDHLRPTDQKMVVTGASPENRLVTEINAEPAAREYARILGKDPEQLTPFTFAAHPVLVKIGGEHHVRAIQRVADNGDLIFFSAIDEGLVLTLAEPEDIAAHLSERLARLSKDRTPQTILACDCVLRRVEVEQSQRMRQISEILSENNVVGFNTYGEQMGPVHVNQTMTGVAIYPPETKT